MNSTCTTKKFPKEKFFLTLNRPIIEKRWPLVWKAIENAPEPKEVVFAQDVQQSTLIIDGIHLSSAYDQQREAEIQAALVSEDSPSATVYGMGTGFLPRVLLNRSCMKELLVVLMNPAVSLEALTYFDHSDWLSDQRIKLTLAENEKGLMTPFAAVPSCLELATDGASRVRDLVVLELATAFIREGQDEQKAVLVKRLEENLPFINSDGDVSELFGKGPGGTILIAAAGPTLSRHYEWIRNQTEKDLLIAVDAALKPLIEESIVPDIVVTADPNREGVYRFFEGLDLTPLLHSFLVYFPVVHSDTLKLWPGRRLTAYTNFDLYRFLIKEHPKGKLFLSGSVLHPAVDLAVKMGASKIFLLGGDFSFPGGYSHAAGTSHRRKIQGEQCTHWVLNGRGKRVATSANMRGYLRDLERYIAQTPGVRFVNGSTDGAHIEGTTYLRGCFR